MRRIEILSPQLANQIAAGEVVERPASIVKELLENSIDAGASQIDVVIEAAGTQLIRVSDNGVGINQADLGKALCRHATSKIYDLSELEGVATLGFRGEALASVASVSHLKLTSRQQDSEYAGQVSVSGRDMQTDVVPASHPVGTTVEVRDLFFNTPARRKFLKTDKTEFAHLEEVVKRLALSHFEIGFSLKRDGKWVYQVKPAQGAMEREQRIQALFGQDFLQNALAIEMSASGLKLWGWVDCQLFHVRARISSIFM